MVCRSYRIANAGADDLRPLVGAFIGRRSCGRPGGTPPRRLAMAGFPSRPASGPGPHP